MTFTFKLAKRIAMVRAPALALIFGLSAGCTGDDELGPRTDPPVLSMAPEDTVASPPAPPITPEDTILGPTPPPRDTVLPPPPPPRDTVLPPPSAPTDTVLPPPPATSFSGIPLGAYDVPASAMTSFSGAVVTTTPSNIVNITSAARMAGARVMLRLTGNAQLQNADGTFSLRKWKAAVDRYVGVDLSLIADGTIAGHILVQNPHRADQWGGREIPYGTLEEMARYSRMRWPGLPTVVKAPLSWLAATPTPWRYLDAASTVYAGAAGDVENWGNRQARTAANAGLGLLVGISVLDGPLAGGQLASWGSVLLNQDHVCGLVMYRYNAAYFGRPDVRNAVAYLVEKARTQSRTSCRVRS